MTLTVGVLDTLCVAHKVDQAVMVVVGTARCHLSPMTDVHAIDDLGPITYWASVKDASASTHKEPRGSAFMIA